MRLGGTQISAALTSTLLTDEEFKAGPDAWSRFTDPW